MGHSFMHSLLQGQVRWHVMFSSVKLDPGAYFNTFFLPLRAAIRALGHVVSTI